MKKILVGMFLSARLFAMTGKKPVEPGVGQAPEPASDISFELIKAIAANSKCAAINWPGRGVAPKAFIKGHALTYAKAYCSLGKSWVKVTAQANTGDDNKDAISWYNSNFKRVGMDNSKSGKDTLRHLYALGVSFAMRESSGAYCTGRDLSAGWTAATTAEAGLFQTSWNAASSTNGEASKIMAYYKENPSKCLLEVYKQGVGCKAHDAKIYGEGVGAEYQKLAKSCPAFATEFAMLTLRTLRRHYGPINTKAAVIDPKCDDMLLEVERALAKNPDLCLSL